MRLLTLSLQGLRSFRERQEIDFTKLQPGLYYVTGENKAEPELAANGVGKSSLFEAVFWLFYGKTTRDVRAGDVRSWGLKSPCSVEATFELNSKHYTLKRSWGPNALTLGDESTPIHDVDQAQVSDLLKLSPEAFLASILFAQFTPSFIDLSRADRMDLYSSVMNLEKWEGYADAAGTAVGTFRREEADLQLQLAKLNGELQALDNAEIKKSEELWVTEQSKRVAALQKEVKLLTDTATKLKAHAENKVQDDSSKIRKQLDTIIAKDAELQTLLRMANQNYSKALSDSNKKVCPTCGSLWKGTTSAQAVAQHKEQCNSLEKDLLRTKSLKTQLQAEYSELETRANAARRIQADTAQAKSEAGEAGRKLIALQREKNPYTSAVRLNADRQKKVLTEVSNITTGIAEIAPVVEAAAFWVKGFKDIRLSLIEESLEQLNVEVNDCLYQLGLQDWAIEFSIEQETKSGSIRRGFHCGVSSPSSAANTPWEAWSGGESQRLRVAVNLGVSNLICQRLGLSPSIEFFDEPSTWLSETGITSLLTLLQDRAIRQKKIILLADHRVLDFGGFAGVISITKDSQGSSLSITV